MQGRSSMDHNLPQTFLSLEKTEHVLFEANIWSNLTKRGKTRSSLFKLNLLLLRIMIIRIIIRGTKNLHLYLVITYYYFALQH